MADREVRVLLLGDSSSLQTATVKAEATTASFETRLQHAVVVSGEAGGMSDGLARKMSAMNQLGFTPATLGLIGLTAGLGVAVEAIGSMIDRSEKLTQAQEQLTNAIEDNGYMVDQTRAILDKFLTTNRRYIDDQATVINGYADMLRAGVPIQNLQRDLSLALDVSIAKHKPLAEVIQAVTNAELGRTRGLVEMGVNIKEITALANEETKDTTAAAKANIEAQKATEQHAVAVQKLADFEAIHANGKKLTIAQLIQERDLKQKVTETTDAETKATQAAKDANAALGNQTNVTNAALDAASAKYKDAHTKLSDLKQAQNDLNASENDFSQRYGPAMETALANGLDIINLTIQLIQVLADKTIPHLIDQLKAAWGAGGGGPQNASGIASNPGGPYGALPPIPDHHGPSSNMNVTINVPAGDNGTLARDISRQLGRVFA